MDIGGVATGHRLNGSDETVAMGSAACEEASGPPALHVSDVSKRFGQHLALAGLTLEVQPGEVHGLVGHNGSGKSTLVKVLAGFHRPEPGATAAVHGTEFALGDAQAARAAGLRFVHQDLGLVETLGAVDNLFLGQRYPSDRIGRIDWRAAGREAEELLASLGYDLDVRVPVGKLSLVDRTGVAIARAVRSSGTSARVLVLDEPTAALPLTSVRELFDVIGRLKARGLGILYISHHLEEIFEIADRVTTLRDGAKVATRPTTGLAEDELIESMVGKVIDVHRRRAPSARSSSTILQVRDLAAGPIHGFDLDVGAGEIVGIAGVAGSGRDELAGALFGSRSRGGTVMVDGHTVRPGRPDESIERGMGLLAADRAQTGLFGELSVRENLTLPRLESSLRGLFLDRRREERGSLPWLERLDVQPRDPRFPTKHLSGGNQQKVVLARWLRAEPKVLILDEPTQGVDVGAVDKIYSTIESFSAQGTAFLVCSSDTDELVALCDRVIVLNRGAVVAELTGPAIERDAVESLCLQAVSNGSR